MADEQDSSRRIAEQLSESGIKLASPTAGLKTKFARAASAPVEGSVKFLDARFPAPHTRTFCRAEPLLDVQIADDPPGPLPPPAGQVRIFAWDGTGQPKPSAFFTFRMLLYADFPTG